MMRRLALLAWGGLLSSGIALAAAPGPRAASTACQASGPATTQRIRLKALLQELAAQRRFRVEYWAHDDPEVVRVAGGDVEVIAALASHANLLVRYVPAGPRCPGELRIDTVWVLPAGRPDVPAVPRAAPPTPPDAATVLYMQAHGAAPAVRPAASATER